MRARLVSIGFLLSAGLIAGCTAELEDSGELPDIDVEGGRAPQIDINPAEIEITTDTQTVRVPDIDVRPSDP